MEQVEAVNMQHSRPSPAISPDFFMEITDVRALNGDEEGAFDFPDDHLPPSMKKKKKQRSANVVSVN